jgi:Ankyrin repeats (many copies)
MSYTLRHTAGMRGIFCLVVASLVGVGCASNVDNEPAPAAEELRSTPLTSLDKQLIAAAADTHNPQNAASLAALLKQGANPNAKDAEGNTAVHHAVAASNAAGLTAVLANGGLLTLKNKAGATPLMRYFEITFSPFGTPPYIVRAYAELSAVIQRVLGSYSKAALGLDLQDQGGETLLYKYAVQGRLDDVRLALRVGANPNLRDTAGNTVAMVVARNQPNDYVETLIALVNAGAELRVVNKSGDTILSLVPNEMSKSLSVLILKLKGQAYLDEIRVLKATVATERSANGALVLLSYSNKPTAACRALDALRNDLASWRARIGEAVPTQRDACACIGIECRVIVGDGAPSRFTALEGTRSAANGPNCFNAALYANGNLAQLRHTNATEMLDYAQSACREKLPTEVTAPGDLIVVFYKPVSFGDLTGTEGPIHAFTVVSDEYSFSKDGFDQSVPYSLTFNSDVYRKYAVIPKLRNVTASFVKTYQAPVTPKLREDNGFNYAIRYDCKPNVALSAVTAITTPSLKPIAADLATLEVAVARFLVAGGSAQATQTELQKRITDGSNQLDRLTISGRDQIAEKAHLSAAYESLTEGFQYLQGPPGGGFPGF